MEARLRGALWALAAAILLGTPAELALMEHWEEPPQWIPFGLSVLGLLAIAAGALAPSRATVKAARWVLGLCAAGGLFGMFEHLEHNAGFAMEIDSTLGGSALVVEAITGANPLLAPGIFVVAALAGLAATWGHPALD